MQVHTLNRLEEWLVQAQTGHITMDAFLASLMTVQIYVPTSTEVQQNGSGLHPLIYNRRGADMLAVFTDMSRIGAERDKAAPYCLQVNAQWFVDHMTPDAGLILFGPPGYGCELMPDAVARLRSAH